MRTWTQTPEDDENDGTENKSATRPTAPSRSLLPTSSAIRRLKSRRQMGRRRRNRSPPPWSRLRLPYLCRRPPRRPSRYPPQPRRVRSPPMNCRRLVSDEIASVP